MAKFVIFHADHGITADQMEWIQNKLASNGEVEDGFFIKEVKIPRAFGKVPCGLYGPAMGDAPIREAKMCKRSEDRPADRMIKASFRQVGYVQVIGMRNGEEFTLYTVYGGPLAPQNPADPTCKDVEASTKFWNEHALAY